MKKAYNQPANACWQTYESKLALQNLDAGKIVLVYGNGNASQAHVLIEVLLSAYLEKDIRYAFLERTFRGKLFVPGAIFFNLSHTEKSFLIAFSTIQEIGIDLEYQIPRSSTIHELAEYAFSPNERNVLEKKTSEKTFLEIWTLKEAFLKATGIGLIDSLSSLHVVSASGNSLLDSAYSSITFSCPNGETGSLVCSGNLPSLSRMHILM